LFLLYTAANFYELTVLALKRFTVVEKEENAPIFHFKLCSFVDRGAKIVFAVGVGCPSYATVANIQVSI